MASRRIEDLHPLLAYAFGKAEAEFLRLYPDAPKPFLTATFRSNEEQEALYKQVPKVTNARAGQSAHNYLPSLALDVAFQKNGKLDYSPNLFINFSALMLKTAGIAWGGHFKSIVDQPHFEIVGWKTLIKKA